MKTDNELIAEFMGFLRTPQRDNVWKIYWHPEKDVELKVIEMAFERSWDWLMPVVEKITKIAKEKSQQSWFDVGYLLINANLPSAYKAVVEFIKWYQENKS